MQLSPRRKVFACYSSQCKELARNSVPTQDEVQFPDGEHVIQYVVYGALELEVDGKPVTFRSEEPLERSPLYIREGRIIGIEDILEADEATAMTLLRLIQTTGDRTLKVIEFGQEPGDQDDGLTPVVLSGSLCVMQYEEGKTVVLNKITGASRRPQGPAPKGDLGDLLETVFGGKGRRSRQTSGSAN